MEFNPKDNMLARSNVRRYQAAIDKYGREACRKAYKVHSSEGYGAAGILHGVDCGYAFKTVSQVDAAINAGRFLSTVEALAQQATNQALADYLKSD